MVSLKPVNCAYTFMKAKRSFEAKAGGTPVENLFIKFKECQGETFNNIVTAVGTAGVAPIFIIHNPLANEDDNTKKYTAARQPISAIITLGAQVPIMKAYNEWIERMAVKHHFDKCDLAAAPTKAYLKDGIKQDYIDYLYKKSINDPEAIAISENFKTPKEVKEYLFQRRKYQAFYDELKFLRESVRNNNPPEYLAKSFRKNGHIKVDDLISCKDIKLSTKELIEEYFKDKFNVEFGTDIKLNDKVKIDSMDSFKQKIVKNALKEAGIEFTKENKKELKQIIKDKASGRAKYNVSSHLIKEARIKLYSHKIYIKAKAEMAEYIKQLTLQDLPKEEFEKQAMKKNDEILNRLYKHAQSLVDKAPYEMPKGQNCNSWNINNISLTKQEAITLVEKLKNKVESKDKNERLIKHLRTSEGTTFKELYKSVQVKQWLKARINNSEKYLSDFKQKSGIVVGLAILPFTCGILNWAYPRIMDEWFPHLSKKPAPDAKEAK